ncbi:MAG: flippase [Chloroflexi bacterium]|jgi:O-antigen/teichoic acid export membrane protein|nr:flippase [Chloroflexota bacterium]
MASGVQRFIRDVGWSFASLAISAFAHFILRTFLARYLGTDDLGLYTLAFTVYSFGMIFAAVGIGAALIKYVAENKEDAAKIGIMVSSGTITAFLIGSIVGLVLYASSSTIANNFFDMPELEKLLHIVAFAFPFIALEKATLGFLNGKRLMSLFASINITQNILTIIFTLILVLLGCGLTGAVVGLVVPICICSLFSLFAIRTSLGKTTFEQYIPVTRTLLVFGVYVALTNGIGMLWGNMDSLMIGGFLSEEAVGLYAVAFLLSQVIQIPSLAIQIITTPTIATYWGKGDVGQIENMVNRMMKTVAIFIIPIVFLMVFLSHEIITLLFGEKFTPAVLPFQILLIGGVFAAILTTVGGTLSSTGYVKVLFKLSIAGLVLNMVFNLLLIPPFGITGAAIATSTSTTLAVMFVFYLWQRLLNIRIHWEWFAKLFTFAALLMGTTYGLGIIVNSYVCILISFIVLVVTLLKYFVTKEDLRLIKIIMGWAVDDSG